jgi:DNA (cytosine-5)-methyltransferase 1
MIKVGSDFSGVGAFNQALIRLGIDYKEVFACDMDKYARQTFVHNYGEPEYYPTNVYDRDIPSEPLDIYMTSPPCQAFSLAGKRLGKEDKRGILFFNSHEFIKVNKPRYFIFENVKGLLSDDNGNTFNEWVNLLGGKSVNGMPIMFPYEDSVPYHIYWNVLNAKEHGVPQNRERVFIVGIRDDFDNKFRFPIEERLIKKLKDVLEDDVDDKYYLSENAINNIIKSKFNQDFKDNNTDYVGCIIAGYGKIPSDGNYIKVKSATSKGYEEASNSLTTVQKDNVLVFNNKRINETLEKHELQDGEVTLIDSYNKSIHKETSPTISTRVNASSCTHLWDGYEIRRLTPRECFRLMDFPDTFTWPVSDSQAYKQAGNSIVVNVLYKIIKNLNL